MKVKVLLADDHKIVRDGLCALISGRNDMEIIAEASNGREAVQLARKHRPDIVVMDVSMPDLNGIDATREILKQIDGIKVIALSMHSDRQYVDGMLRAGVSGYLLKDCAADELIPAIHCVRDGRIYLSTEITGFLVQDYLNPNKSDEMRNNCLPSDEKIDVLR